MFGAAFKELFIETKSPEVHFFKMLKTSWDSLDLADVVLTEMPADHNACWMVKSIFILKMSLLLLQLSDLHWQTKKVLKMTLFVVFAYVPAWFNAGSLRSAATNDLKLFQRLQKFRTVHKKVSSSTSTASPEPPHLVPLRKSLCHFSWSTRASPWNLGLPSPNRLEK